MLLTFKTSIIDLNMKYELVLNIQNYNLNCFLMWDGMGVRER